MKLRKIGICLVVICLLACLGVGCGQKVKELDSGEGLENIEVYSFSGEDELFRINNGIIVISEGEQLLNGGEMVMLKDIEHVASYSTTFYMKKDGVEEAVLSNSYSISGDEEGMSISGIQALGGISSADALGGTLADSIKDHLCFKLDIKYINGEKAYHALKLNVEDVKPKKS